MGELELEGLRLETVGMMAAEHEFRGASPGTV